MYPIPANATRIRYLEGTGDQFIDTGYKTCETSRMLFDATYLGYQYSGYSSTMLFGSQTLSGGSAATALAVWLNSNGQMSFNDFGFDSGWIGSPTISAGSRHTYEISGRSLFVDGSLVKASTASDSYRSTVSVCLLRANTPSGYQTGNNRHMKGRIYSFQASEGGELKFNGVPVRVGSVGYLFDRVTGQLFANSGTGSFVLGPDTFQQGVLPTRMMAMGVRRKAGPSSLDYVQDGLVAMWDGIENAGIGVHDATSATWKDLVGEHDFAVVLSDSEWEADAFYAKNRNAATSGFMDFSSSMTLQFVIKDNLSPATNTGNAAFVILGAHDGRYFGLLHRPSNNAYMADRAYYSQSISAGYKCLSFSNISQTVASMWADGSIVSSSGYNSLDVTSNRGNVARIGGTADLNRAIKLHCIRIYNRALSASEIAANYAIDKARFNLP